MKKILVLFAAVLFSTVGYSQKPLVLNLKKGETYIQKSSVDTKVTQQVQGNSMEIGMLISSNISFKVVDKKDSILQIEMAILNLKSSVTTQFGSQTFDSDIKKEGDPFSTVFSQIIGKPFKATISNTGRVLNIESSNFFSGAIASSKLPEAQANMIKAQLDQILGDKVFKDQIESSFVMCTNKPVGKGSKWSKSYLAQRAITFQTNNNFEIIDETPEAFTIKYTGEITTDPNAPIANMNGMNAKYSLNGNIEGTMVISKSTGWVIENKAEQLVKGTIDIQPSTQIPEGMQVPMSITSTVSITNK